MSSYGQPGQPGGYPPPQGGYGYAMDPMRARAYKLASDAFTMAIVGFFILGIILEPLAIMKAREAKRMLTPGEEGYSKANTAETLGWVAVGLWVLSCVCCVISFVVIGASGSTSYSTY